MGWCPPRPDLGWPASDPVPCTERECFMKMREVNGAPIAENATLQVLRYYTPRNDSQTAVVAVIKYMIQAYSGTALDL